jgi:hypothetical protein
VTNNTANAEASRSRRVALALLRVGILEAAVWIGEAATLMELESGLR